MPQNMLFHPLQLRGLTLKNRAVVAPMCQYAATDGKLNDWHFVHLSQFAQGGFGLVFVEATAVEARGRITPGCSGLWSDDHIAPMKRIVDSVHARGAAIGVQLAHAGRKASLSAAYAGDKPLSGTEPEGGSGIWDPMCEPWQTVGPSAIPFAKDWPAPQALTASEIREVVDAWGAAAKRADQAGFDTIEIHSAHGYLGHSFLSPLSNHRTDAYGGDLENRMRFTLEIIESVRANLSDHKPLFLRISSIDGKAGGWAIEDSVVLAKRAKALGVDVVDCSSGGIAGYGENTLPQSSPGYQTGFAAAIRREADVKTQAVGLIVDPGQAESVLRSGQADLVALAREALYNPYWVRHAAAKLNEQNSFLDWPIKYGFFLEMRSKGLFLARPGDSDTMTVAGARDQLEVTRDRHLKTAEQQ
ncbi:NADH:flavin oxidoreductase/NADH oxidase (plasmid) [Aminobacter sp. SR38]|jgi:2,4-dienoyl-CoA reductase-like NADH-dependent reductase (Old Yellow Enzyme family)|uniref:NADH:flavin oxidoreductase/NADH oxidase n=1 Tax=Aminobacter sp. SR38 TaxID=2774562 RepID=UPI00177FEC28|nr:NADH:flavin oxidoreductase/NADH oxidase [Aminobacter sp. SR38]QOF75490.1 NADH:flavin oxidoreductase/NADH oxidase [Aminobacter sp. SR38]